MALAKERIPHESSLAQQEAMGHSVINFKNNVHHSSSFHDVSSASSLLSFEKNEHSSSLTNYLKTNNGVCLHHHDNNDSNYQCISSVVDPAARLSGEYNCFQTASNYGSSLSNPSKQSNDQLGSAYGWLYSEENLMADSFTESKTQAETAFPKRPHMGESMQPLKKQCTSDTIAAASATTKKPKSKSPSPSKDPQSIAAKNRRERISERLKILQELVPNGCKVDLVTMLEKAISYVKFLQLQVKVLATDEFWPVQGGKAPDISQVKEAIDAILSSQRETSSSSKL